MSEETGKRRLGRGLAALIGEIDRPEETQAPVARADGVVPIEMVVANPRNPRRTFGENDLTDLAQSIREHGVVQPVIVRPGRVEGTYEIIAGERRWRASQRAGITQLPVLIREVDDRVALELAIVENVQRADLNPVEEAMGYQQLIDEHSYTQADLGQVIGKSRSHVANTLRLLKLPTIIQDMLTSGTLSAGHARTLVTAADPSGLAKRIVEEGLSVRQAEALAQAPESKTPTPSRTNDNAKDADTLALEKMLSDQTGLRVTIQHKEKGGEIKIAYRSLEQLDELCRRLQA
ncbi:ParB/RepB/Spo0J family partition protein [Tianweitania sp. BSSL-BM11]|uniref:ParB/RepB/Spo0J family partition protein n=1 Tax=Tianweitania aestuarii TaxID=2814886 RepID=A0ABS5RX29_9HYPH|nr:ParB/RepB/Spo0J family partition protein [Tianweitania aestuarii]MBS9721630.1 ParB/RepB/Spo0J family partition protein [Tianweitania aestuarii]